LGESTLPVTACPEKKWNKSGEKGIKITQQLKKNIRHANSLKKRERQHRLPYGHNVKKGRGELTDNLKRERLRR